MKKFTLIILAILICSISYLQAQVAINTTGLPPDNSAMLDVASETSGVLIPRMTIVQRDAISSPATGLMIYQIDNTPGFYYFDGTLWKLIGGADFSNGGEAGGADRTLGNTDNYALGFKTNDATRLHITNNGNVGVGTTTPDATFHVSGDDGVLFGGSFGNGTPLYLGGGTKMMWYPIKSAFRAGTADDTQWDDTNIGNYSIASGRNTIASGEYSVAMGFANLASGSWAVALGDMTTASGDGSTALGDKTTASGHGCTAIGDNTTANGWIATALGGSTLASGDYSTAMGSNTTAGGESSTAMGSGTTASGVYSTAIGHETISSEYASVAMGQSSEASGFASFAMGNMSVASGGNSVAMVNSIASGASSVAIGEGVKAESPNSIAVGAYNIGGGNPTEWIWTDPIFEIGCGPGEEWRTNAMTVLKNGNVGIGTTTPDEYLHVAGNMRLDGIFVDDNGDGGLAGQILSSTETGTDWINASGGGDFSNGGEAEDADRTLGNTDNYSLGLITNNTTRLHITDNGNVGIGTNNPQDILQIVGGNARIGEVTDDDGSTAGYGDRLYFSGGDDWPPWDSDNSDPLWIARFNVDDNESELRVGIGDDDWGSDKFVVGIESGSGWDPHMAVLGTGHVGIGTMNPAAHLTVTSNDSLKWMQDNLLLTSSIGQPTFRLDQTADTTSLGFQLRQVGEILVIERRQDINTVNGMMVFDYENKNIFSYLPVEIDNYAGYASTKPLLRLEHFESPTTDYLQVASHDSVKGDILTIDSSGNLGIGTATPAGILDIAGEYHFPATDGNSGQVLKTDGSGVLSWATANGDFSNGGEAGGADRTLGNTDNYALSFKTNNSSHLKIQSDGGIRMDGNLGIFTDPSDASHINKSIQLYASGTYSNPYLKISGHNSAYIYLESRRTSTTSGKTWSIASGGGSTTDLDKFFIYNGDDGYCFTIRDGGNVGIQELNPVSRLVIKAAGSTSSTSALNIKDVSDNSLFYVRDDGNVGIGTTTPAAKLDIVGSTGYNQLRMRTSYTPTGTSDTNGNSGDIAWDDSYVYIKTSTGWKRSALSTW